MGVLNFLNFYYFNMMWVAWETLLLCKATNIERHGYQILNVLDRKAHWEKAWSSKPAQESSWYQEVPLTSLSMIKNAQLGNEAPLIDVGGGASLLVDHLLEAQHRDITVLDISPTALKQARHRLADLANHVDWIEADITRCTMERPFLLWHDRAAFHFLVDADDRKRYVKALNQGLQVGGQAIIACFAPDGPKKCSGLDIVQYDADGLQSVLGSGMRLLEQRLEHHQTPAGREQIFGFYRFEHRQGNA